MKRYALLCLIALMPQLGQAIEEPDFSVIRKIGAVEIRQYALYVVAEVVVGVKEEVGVRSRGRRF